MSKVATIGNATLIAYDTKPILATDPWFSDEDSAYFGSWMGSHNVPQQYKDDMLNSEFLWFSHGHPDHINPNSLKRFKGKKILLPDHYGSRIYNDLINLNYEAIIMKDKKWYDLSPNIKVQCITNWLQDSILLIQADQRLFINLNDAGCKYYIKYLKKITKNYKNSYLLSLSGYGDADMINFFSEDGTRVTKSKKNALPPGKQLSDISNLIGTNNIIPFSSFHQYQRSDSIWAQDHTAKDEDYRNGISDNHNFIDPFSIIDCRSGKFEKINPTRLKINLKKPIEFGDDWSDQLSKNEFKQVYDYFITKKKLSSIIGFVRFIVGKKEHFIKFDNKLKSGITFEVPKNSLLITTKLRIFDDLLIGNFMKTTLHEFPNLYHRNFKYIIANWSDNGNINSEEEFREYMNHYEEKVGQSFLYFNFLDQSKNMFLRFITKNPNSILYQTSKKIYNLFR